MAATVVPPDTGQLASSTGTLQYRSYRTALCLLIHSVAEPQHVDPDP
jgi:hypothetical protein